MHLNSWLSHLIRQRIALFFSGLMIPFAFAPFHQWWIALLSLTLFLWLTGRAKSARHAFVDGGCYGIGVFFGGVHWVYVSVGIYGTGGAVGGVVAIAALVGYLALFPALASLGAHWLTGGKNESARRTLLGLLWLVMEWFRGWFLTGFPWLFIGHAMIDSPLAPYAPIGGSLLMGAIALATARALVMIFERTGATRFILPIAVLAVWLMAMRIDPVVWSRPTGDPIQVALVQGNIAQDLKWLPEKRDETIEHYLRMSEPLWGEVDWIIWPETAVPDFFHSVYDSFIEPLYERAQQEKTAILFGIPMLDFTHFHYYNAVWVFGDEPYSYYKRHLVPFGEYLPLRRVLGDFLIYLGMPSEDFTPGKLEQTAFAHQGQRMAVSVCFEIVQPYLIRRDAKSADWLVNISNDAWFGNSLAPHQHLQIARLRALETNRPLVRSTNTGISAIIAADGKITERAPQFVSAVVRGEVAPRTGLTPYVRWGDLPTLLGLCVALASIVVPLQWKQRRRAQAKKEAF